MLSDAHLYKFDLDLLNVTTNFINTGSDSDLDLDSRILKREFV